MVSSVEELLGRVTQHLPAGGEDRPGQREMAQEVAKTVANKSTSLVEAGTGTGKSLAYLTPIVAAEKRAVIATATIALQEQLVGHDVPQVARGLDTEISVAVLKGRSNYLCLQRFEELERASHAEQLDLLRGQSPSEQLIEVRDWAEETSTGDKEELDPAPPYDVWQAVSVSANECPGAKRCPAGDRCFAEKARAKALESDVIVTNHHYYGLNIDSGGALLPEHDVVIFDEAHHLPDVLAATCGTELSGGRLRAFARRVRTVLTDDDLALAIDRSAGDIDHQIRDSLGDRIELDVDTLDVLATARERINKVVGELRKANPKEGSDAEAKVERAQLNANTLIGGIDQIIEAVESDVLWIDGSDANPVLRRTPLEIGDLLKERLWGERAVVLTSATMPAALVSQLGLDDEVEVTRVGSPFDYESLGLLYCATHLPEPRNPASRQAVRDEMHDLIVAAGGRTLGLFTSYGAMREAADDLRERLDFTVLMQGDHPKPILIEKFKAEPSAVLLATMSFWQGVDLPGDTLTLVTIDRIPFPRPDEPVTQAQRDRAGRYAFMMVDIPRAQTLLAQAAGRLVRRQDDRGVVAVLDSRLATKKSYRWELIGALPPFRRTRDRDEVMEYLRSLDTSS